MDSHETTYSYHFAKTTFRARQYHTPCSVFLWGAVHSGGERREPHVETSHGASKFLHVSHVSRVFCLTTNDLFYHEFSRIFISQALTAMST